MATHVTLASRSSGALQQLTEGRPGLTIDAFPLGRLLLLRCFGDVDGIEKADEIKNSESRLLHQDRTTDGVTLLLDGRVEDEATIAALDGVQAHLVPPIRWARGEARFSFVVEDGMDVPSLVASFPGARLVSKRRGRPMGKGRPVDSPLFLPDLTEKQARALLAAYDAGYYRFPRGATTEEVSTSLGLARSTFEQHLNRAEHLVAAGAE